MNPFDRFHAAVEDGGVTRHLLPKLAVGTNQIPPIATERIGAHRKIPARVATVSVIIPCFNYARFLPESVGSVLVQDGVDVEVIVVDDASTDGTAGVAAKLHAKDSRVRVMRNVQNAGHVVSFNNGYADAQGEFIVRLDADDLLTPGSLQRAVALFERFPNVGLVYGRPRHFHNAAPPTPRRTPVGWTVWSGRDWLQLRCRLGVNCITTPEAMMRSSVMRAVGPLNTRLRFAQDMEMWLRAASVSDVGHVNGPDQAMHREHAESMSVTTGSGILVDLTERRMVFEELFSAMASDVDGSADLHDQARRALASEALTHARRTYERRTGDEGLVHDLVSFAHATYSQTRQLRAWRLYESRTAAARPTGGRALWFQTRAGLGRVRTEYRYLRWSRTGI